MKYTARLLTVTTFSLFFPSLLLAQEELPMENSDPSNTTNAVEQAEITTDDESFFSDESLQAKEDDAETLEEDDESEVNASADSNSTNISSQAPQNEEDKPAPIIFNEDDFTQKVKLQALNKITARTISIEVTKGNSVKFGNLEITLHRCWRAPETEIPESKALLFIQDKVPGQEVRTVFEGWMFASSPSISTLEHPVYDVRVLECIADKKVDASPKSSKPE